MRSALTRDQRRGCNLASPDPAYVLTAAHGAAKFHVAVAGDSTPLCPAKVPASARRRGLGWQGKTSTVYSMDGLDDLCLGCLGRMARALGQDVDTLRAGFWRASR